MISIQFRRGTAAQWTTANPVLGNGELGYETDTCKFKIGDGATAWTSLDYVVGDNTSYGLLQQGLAAARPAAAIAGRLYYSTDTGVLERDTGTAWEEKARAETATRLASLSEKAHGSLTGIGTSDHHIKTTSFADMTDRAGMARMPDGTSGYVLTAQGAGLDPSYATGGGADDAFYGLLHQGLAANRPAAGIVGRQYYSSDTLVLERDTGTAWEEKARGETATRLAQLSERAHSSLTGIGASDHHVKTVSSDIDHGSVLGLADDDHPQYIKHSLATAISDFLVASGAGAFIKKTLAEVKTLLDWAADIATHAGLTTDVHGVGANYIPAAPAASHLVRTFTKGWTADKLLKGAGVDADPVETLLNWELCTKFLLPDLMVRRLNRIWFSKFDTYDMVANSVSGSGSVSQLFWQPRVITGTTSGSKAVQYGNQAFGWLNLNLAAFFYGLCILVEAGAATAFYGMTLATTDHIPLTTTLNHVGFI